MPLFEKGHKIENYTVQCLIKENQYTQTYRVEDDDFNPYFLKAFVIKRMPGKLTNEETGYVYEIEYSRNIKHKNIISFISCGKTETIEGECQYYTTDYFSGELLSEKIYREGKITEDEAILIYKEILHGLKHVHDMDICHNDITPRNIMLSQQGGATVPEIIDLGHVSKKCCGKVPFDVSDLELFYSANETFAGIYDSQSDIFAATAVLYTMLTGKRPWETELPNDAKRSRKSILLKEFRKSNPIDFTGIEVSDKAKTILAKGLSLTFEERYKDVDAVLADIEADNITFPCEEKEEKNPKKYSQSTKREDVASTESHNKVDFEIKRGGGNGFKDIAGMKTLKDYLQQRVIFVIQNKEQAEKYRLTTPNGMLLYGPPGCGKTFVAEKFAEETGFNFILVKSSDVASSYLHGSQEKIAQLFKQAENNAPIVICFDEFDSLVPDRSSPAANQTSSEVNEFLTQLNNCSKRGIFVIGTTNRPDKIDPAVLRTGRIDKLVYVPLPDQEARKEMFCLHIEGRPCDSNINFDKLAELTDGYIASDIAYVVNDAAMVAAFTNKEITQELLEETISNTHPSLSKDVISIYENIRGNMESSERRNMGRPKIGFIQYD